MAFVSLAAGPVLCSIDPTACPSKHHRFDTYQRRSLQFDLCTLCGHLSLPVSWTLSMKRMPPQRRRRLLSCQPVRLRLNMHPAGFQTMRLGRLINSSVSPASPYVMTLLGSGLGGGNSGLE